MTFDKDRLQAIILMGQQGKSTALIARDLGMTSDQLDDERKANKDLDDALKRAEFNFKEVARAKLYADALSGKNVGLAKEIYLQLQNELGDSDNEIIIREV